MRKTATKNYSAIHKWLAYHFGKATLCENSDCPNTCTKFEWALKTGRSYEYERDNFTQLCASCHRKMDFTEEDRAKIKANNQHRKKTHCSRGHAYEGDNVRLINGKRYCNICIKYFYNHRGNEAAALIRSKAAELTN